MNSAHDLYWRARQSCDHAWTNTTPNGTDHHCLLVEGHTGTHICCLDSASKDGVTEVKRQLAERRANGQG
jgi:hypothetical protein